MILLPCVFFYLKSSPLFEASNDLYNENLSNTSILEKKDFQITRIESNQRVYTCIFVIKLKKHVLFESFSSI